jgi:prefoldin subunit 5
MELNKTIQDLKREVDTIKKTQSETTLEIKTLGKKSETIDVSISNRIQEMEERSQVQKIPERTPAQQSKKMQNAKRS